MSSAWTTLRNRARILAPAMNEPEDFIIEAEAGERTAQGERTGWELVIFEVADEESESE